MEQCILSFETALGRELSVNVANAYAVKRATGFFVDIYYNTFAETAGKVQVLTLNFQSIITSVGIVDIIYNAILEAQQAPRSIVKPVIPNADGGKLYGVLPLRWDEKDPI